MTDDIYIEALSSHEDDPKVAHMIKRALMSFSDSNIVLAATFRRIQSLTSSYADNGCRFYVAKHRSSGDEPIACVGLGPLHGLPSSDGMGEIRDLVVEERFRGRGLGSRLLHLGIMDAKELGYQRLYLETSKQMLVAQHLFIRAGFRPVVDRHIAQQATAEDMPCYFLLEKL